MSILVIASNDDTPLPWPRKGYRRITPTADGTGNEAWRRKVGRAVAGVDVIVSVQRGMERFGAPLRERVSASSAMKIAIFPQGTSDSAPHGVDVLITDGAIVSWNLPTVDADLTDPTMIVGLVDSLVDERWRVYLLGCGDGTYYTGVSKYPVRRFLKHQAGKGARYTRGRGPLKMLALSPPLTKGGALSFEASVKKRLPREEKPSAVRLGP